MQFYTGIYFDSFSDQHKKQIVDEIKSEQDNYILNINIDDYSAHLLQKFKLNFPEFYLDKVFVDTIEKDIPASRFPRYDFMFPDNNKTFRKQVIIYHLPYSGDVNLLKLKPNPMTLMHYDANIDTRQNCIIIEIINFYNDPEKIKKQYNDDLSNLMCNYSNLKKNCNSFNEGLESFIRICITSRRQEILQHNNILSSLGVPIKKKEGIVETFSIPNPKLKDKIIVKPSVINKDYKPEPSLDDSNYQKILKIINDVGKNFERMPSTYKEKSEEDLRDHILFTLDPNFEYGSAGGETFNKIGKTDISLRYDSSVVFIAECKYWKGEKVFIKTIDQLLGYLTWRNSKTAIINFVQNVEFSDVLKKIKETSIIHPNFLKEMNDTDESWFNYKFHLNGDRNRELNLAVLSFHLPK